MKLKFGVLVQDRPSYCENVAFIGPTGMSALTKSECNIRLLSKNA